MKNSMKILTALFVLILAGSFTFIENHAFINSGNSQFLIDNEQPQAIGNDKVETRNVSDFSTISLNISADVFITQGNKTTLEIDAGEKALRNLITRVSGDELIIKWKDNDYFNGEVIIKITMKDIEEMVELVKNIIDIKQNVKINMSVSTFVPKTFTPFQWEKVADVDDILEKQKYILQHLPKRRVKISFHKLGLSRLEAVFARGDKKLADVVEKAFKLGCRFDDWSERLDESKWAEAFKETGINPENYLKEIPETTPLPWDVLNFGVTKDFLLKEKHNAENGLETPYCREDGCVNCGVNINFKC
jgi:uncharacterized protein YxeA